MFFRYWIVCQQLAHHTVNGSNLNPGDLLASRTISGPDDGSMGSMLEQSMGGRKDIMLEHGGSRKFLKDGDEVVMTAVCKGNGFNVGFGACTGKILPVKV
ncbi:hypothetical protein KC19_11G036700 [Ceratodon purpureus]|uniref:Fumarylacetoacetase n=1 Tax=Ceratodon purpureus TaxID=3225 RepID=A0A8T0GDQ4_CERPU|nr:hypothetical protein KC19_11G036700 [Ceratodon purpureus]